MTSESRNWSQWIRDKVRGLAWYPLQHEDATGLADEIDRLNAIVERMPKLTLRQLQHEQEPWVRHNFPGREAHYPLLGVQEEVGELSHAHLKALQGIRGTPEEHHAAKVDAVADIIIFLSDYCTASGIDLQDAVERTWAQVKQRDWRASPTNGYSTRAAAESARGTAQI